MPSTQSGELIDFKRPKTGIFILDFTHGIARVAFSKILPQESRPYFYLVKKLCLVHEVQRQKFPCRNLHFLQKAYSYQSQNKTFLLRLDVQ